MGGEIFEGPVSEWTDQQLELVNWCGFYHSVMNPHDGDAPDAYTLENDALLDHWLEEKEKKKRLKAVQQQAGMSSGPKSAMEHQNVVEFG